MVLERLEVGLFRNNEETGMGELKNGKRERTRDAKKGVNTSGRISQAVGRNFSTCLDVRYRPELLFYCCDETQ